MKRPLAPLAIVALTAAACAPAGRMLGCPSVDALRDYRPPEATRVYAMDGSLLADLSVERRVVVALEDMPDIITNGFVAVEDRRFREHGGVDGRGIGRAVWRNLTSLSLDEGFSTITMQLARNVFPQELPRGDRFRRKLCEVQMAGRIEDVFSKRDILELYINQVYMGDGLYGVEEAARGYFGKSAQRLSSAEAALLVGLVKNPEGYNPRKHERAAIQRRNTVLAVMVREDVIAEAEATKAATSALTLAPPREAAAAAPYFVAAVRGELRERFGPEADVLGLRVYTGLDPALQRATADAVLAQIRRIENGDFGTYRHPAPDSGKLEPAQGSGSPYLQGMAIIMDIHTGAVRALVGGRDFTHSAFDRALLARRQPGSSFKPIVYAAAFQHGLSPADRVQTTPVTVANTGADWRPDDLVSDTVTNLTARDALALSSNYAAVRVGEWVGVQRVIDMARTLGITTPIPAVPSIFLGAAEVVPAEFVTAYATLANGGMRVRPTLIERVEDTRGNIVWRAPASHQPVLDPGVAFLTVNVLEDVIDHGTGTVVRRNGFWLPAGGKTGTTNQSRDVWFVGVTPDLAGAVWFGFDQPQTIMANAFGGNLAAPVWTEFMKAAYTSRPAPAPWTPPTSLISVAIDATSGGLATPNCPPEHVRIEYFARGTEPNDHCPLHPRSSVDRLIDRLRRIF